MSLDISFGTSGYRGILSKSFTTAHVIAIAQGIASHLKELTETPSIIVGYDNRTGNSPTRLEGSYTQILVDTLLNQGLEILFFSDFSPTPLVAWSIEHYKAQGSVMLTASHNPPNYNGIKFNPQDGSPANQLITQKLDKLSNTFFENPLETNSKPGAIRLIDPKEDFAKHLEKISNQLIPSTASPLSIGIDCRHGATGKTWSSVLEHSPFSKTQLLFEEPKADFGYLEPNPTKTDSLTDLKQYIIENACNLGIANDPDGDRHVLLDETGRSLNPEETATLILDYLCELGIPVYGIATTVASSAIIKKAANTLGVLYEEKAVGFKHFSSFFKQARKQNKVGIAVESSGGISIASHTLEKCGFLPGLLVARIIEHSQKPLSKLKEELHLKYGQLAFDETSIAFDEDKKNTLKHFLSDANETLFKEHLAWPIETIVKVDGTKVIFKEGDWALVRLSGTEPVARIYAESETPQRTKLILEQMQLMLSDV